MFFILFRRRLPEKGSCQSHTPIPSSSTCAFPPTPLASSIIVCPRSTLTLCRVLVAANKRKQSTAKATEKLWKITSWQRPQPPDKYPLKHAHARTHMHTHKYKYVHTHARTHTRAWLLFYALSIIIYYSCILYIACIFAQYCDYFRIPCRQIKVLNWLLGSWTKGRINIWYVKVICIVKISIT